MDYFKETEELLYSVPKKEKALVQLTRRRTRLTLKGAPVVPACVDYEKPYTRATFTSTTLNDVCELADVCRRIAETQAELDEIKSCVEAIGSKELKTCLKRWYWEGLSKAAIAERISRWSATTVYNKRNEAVAEFARIYWGAKIRPEKLKNF